MGITRRELAPEGAGDLKSHRSEGGTCRNPQVSEGEGEFGIHRNKVGIRRELVPADKRKKPRSKIRRYVIISVIILLLILGITVIFLYPSTPDVQLRSIESVQVKWKGPLPEELRIKFIITITNENVLGATVNGVEGKVFLKMDRIGEMDEIGDFYIPGPFDVPGNGKTDVPLYFDLTDLPNPLTMAQELTHTVYIKIKGTVDISFWFLEFTIPFEKETTVPVSPI